jgi:type II secretion system protein J
MAMRQAVDRRRAGFTLIEVLVTVLIMGMLMVSITQILSSVRTSRDTIHNIQETQLAGPAILDLIERDLRGLVTCGILPENQIRVENRVMLGQDGDSIDFVTTTDSLLWTYDGDRSVRADINEVGYRLRTNPDSDDFLQMYRREGFGIDGDEPYDGGGYMFLHDRIKSFDVLVYNEDGIDAEEFEDWNTESADEEFRGVPARVEIALTIETAPRLNREAMSIAPVDRRTYVYRRIIRFPEPLRLPSDQTPRIMVPVDPNDAETTTQTPDGNVPDGSTPPESPPPTPEGK